MCFPNFDQTRSVMMIAIVVHVIAGIWFIIWAFTHIYLGTVGTTGAYEGMRNGYVDETWAREHAQYWYEDVKPGGGRCRGAPGAATATGDPTMRKRMKTGNSCPFLGWRIERERRIPARRWMRSQGAAGNQGEGRRCSKEDAELLAVPDRVADRYKKGQGKGGKAAPAAKGAKPAAAATKK